MEQTDFIFYTSPNGGGIQSGGFSVNSLFMNQGRSPIITLNTNTNDANNSKISDQFNDLVIPSWVMYSPYNTSNQSGGSLYESGDHEDNTVIDDNLYDELLSMAKEGGANKKKKNTRRRLKNINKGMTKRNRSSYSSIST